MSGGIIMKQIYIRNLLESISVPVEIIEKQINNSMMFPVFITKKKSILNSETKQLERTLDCVCSKCNQVFSRNDEKITEIQCPNCNNLNSFYTAKTLNITTEEYQFSDKFIIRKETPEDKIGDIHRIYISVNKKDNNDIPSNGNNYIISPFILSKHIVDDIQFFTLAQYYLYLKLNEETNEKEIIVHFQNNMIIFSPEEIVHIKNGKVSTASFENTYCRYGQKMGFLANEVNANEFIDFISNYKGYYNNPFVYKQDEMQNVYPLNFCFLDNLRSEIKSMKPISASVIKKQEFANTILSTLPTLSEFTVKDESIPYTVLEIDDINCTKTLKHTCPICEEIVINEVGKEYMYDQKEDYICPLCGCVICSNLFVDSTLYINENTVNIISDYDEGIVLFDAQYHCSIENGIKHFSPINNDYKPNTIIVIKKEFDKENLLSNLLILRKNEENGEYSIGKTIRPQFRLGNTTINNIAINFNMHRTNIEDINKNIPYTQNEANIDALAGFILLYRKYPVLEKFIKEKQNQCIQDILMGFDWQLGTYSTKYDLEKNDIPSALRMSKGCIRILNDSKYTFSKLQALTELQLLYSADKNIAGKDYEYIKDNEVSTYQIIDVCNDFDISIHQILTYLERVRVTQCVSPTTAMSEWKDYLSGCKTIKANLSDNKVKYPSALRTEHDKVMYKKKIIDNRYYKERFQEVTKEYGQKYYHKNKEFIITYPKTLNDLFEEGRRLNHCVGSYGDAIKDGKSIILFVRKASEPDTPFFTLEVKPNYNAITQFYGHSDTKPHKTKHKNLILFVKDWATKQGIVYNP
jgi:phage FluMu protein Com